MDKVVSRTCVDGWTITAYSSGYIVQECIISTTNWNYGWDEYGDVYRHHGEVYLPVNVSSCRSCMASCDWSGIISVDISEITTKIKYDCIEPKTSAGVDKNHTVQFVHCGYI